MVRSMTSAPSSDSPDLKVRSHTRPVLRLRSFTRLKAWPLPGFTNSLSRILQGSPSSITFNPGRNSLVEYIAMLLSRVVPEEGTHDNAGNAPMAGARWWPPPQISYSSPRALSQRLSLQEPGAMVGEAKIRLAIPRQDLRAFSFFRLSSVAAREWAMQLPVTRIQAAAQQLTDALTELNRCKVAPETRFVVLETLRPNVDAVVSSLSKRYLNQPLVMPDEPRRMARLGSELLSAAGTGYTVVAIEAIQQRDSLREMNPARLTCESIHRALLHHGRDVLQTFQLYRPLQMQGWRVLHQLFALAESQQLSNLPVPEPLWGADTIQATYLQCVLLGCCKLNQLRQADMALVFKALRDWAPLVKLYPPRAEGGLFVVDINSDQPPLYSALHTRTAASHSRYINTAALIEQLYLAKARAPGQALRKTSES